MVSTIFPETDNSKSDDDDDFLEATEASSVGSSSQFRTISYSQSSERSRQQSLSQASPSSTLYTPTESVASSALEGAREQQSLSYDDDFLAEDAQHVIGEHNDGYLGQICEVRWYRQLRSRIQLRNDPASPALLPPPSETNFYMDDCDIQLIERPNPFLLPPEMSAMALLHCYLRTVHVTFPLISSEIPNQLQSYYDAARRGESVTFPHRWFAIVNLVLAIGAHFMNLTKTGGGSFDETVCFSSACQLLCLNDATMMVFDLPLIQVSVPNPYRAQH